MVLVSEIWIEILKLFMICGVVRLVRFDSVKLFLGFWNVLMMMFIVGKSRNSVVKVKKGIMFS